MPYLLFSVGVGFIVWGVLRLVHGDSDGIPMILAGGVAFFVLWTTRSHRNEGE